MPSRKIIVHVIDRLVIGGMENGIVNIINATSDRFDHKLICVRYSDPEFAKRISVPGIEIFELGKKSGKDPLYYRNLYRLLRKVKPDIVHTRNLPTIDLSIVARVAGVKNLIHGEHGRDILEPNGNNLRYNIIRRLMSPFVNRYVCVSKDISNWLASTVGISSNKIEQIYNGVDIDRFTPKQSLAKGLIPDIGSEDILVGTVGRMEPIKDQLTLVRAFVHLVEQFGEGRDKLKLVIVGEGTLRQPALDILEHAGLSNQAWLPGASNNVADIMKELSVFVLPSLNEGVSNTILEAMSTGLPVIATDVGGNRELVVPGSTGCLVPPEDPQAMCQALLDYTKNPQMIQQHGSQARSLSIEQFSLPQMVSRYTALYESVGEYTSS